MYFKDDLPTLLEMIRSRALIRMQAPARIQKECQLNAVFWDYVDMSIYHGREQVKVGVSRSARDFIADIVRILHLPGLTIEASSQLQNLIADPARDYSKESLKTDWWSVEDDILSYSVPQLDRVFSHCRELSANMPYYENPECVNIALLHEIEGFFDEHIACSKKQKCQVILHWSSR